MLATTLDIIRSGLKSDPSITPTDRTRLLALLRQTPATPGPEAAPAPKPRLIRRGEAAQLLSRSLRTIDKLAASGALKRRTLPGRVRASGFLETDLIALMVASGPEVTASQDTPAKKVS